MNLAIPLLRSAERRPEATALRYGEQLISYADLAASALRFRSGLEALGVASGDRIALMMRNGPKFVESLYGALLAGATLVPLNARLHPFEVAMIVRDSTPAALVHDAEFNAGLAAAFAETGVQATQISTAPTHGELHFDSVDSVDGSVGLVEVSPTSLAWLFYTSGTSGAPKGAMLSHRNLRVMLMNHLADVQPLHPEDVVLHAAPLTHGSGLVLLASIARGASNVIFDGASFVPSSVFQVMQDQQVTCVAFLAPTQIVKLLSEFDPERWELSSLRSVCYGGAPMFVTDLKRALEAFGPVFVQIYGQGEAPMTITRLSAADHARFHMTDDERLASAGVAATDVEVRIAAPGSVAPLAPNETGEVLVRGDVVMSGYWNDDAKTAETLQDGWLRTGDIATIDDRGYLTILDRAKDLIISGGNNVYPREVEDVIVSLEGVDEVAVIGLPDDYWGERVHALVVAADGSVSEDAVIERCRERLGGYKKPQSVEFVDELPKSAYGKVLKREIRERYWQAHARRVAGGAGAADTATTEGRSQ